MYFKPKTLMNIVECIARKEMTDKNGTPFIRLEFINFKFDETTDPTTGEVRPVRIPSKTGLVNQYEYSYTSTGRADPLLNTKPGDLIAGEVITKTVMPYTTEKGTQVNYYSCVVFGDSCSDQWNKTIESEFRRNGHVIMPEAEVYAQKVQIVNRELAKV